MSIKTFFQDFGQSTFKNINARQRKFLRNAGVSLIIWIVIADFVPVHNFLIENLAHASAFTLEIITGVKPSVYCIDKVNSGGEILSNVRDQRGYVRIGSPCDAWDLYYLGVAFFWVFPIANWKRKIFYSILIVIVLYITNVLRVAGLFQISKDYPEWFNLFHKTIFQFIVYAIMFIVWIFYLRKTKLSNS